MSHPMWVRGLKRVLHYAVSVDYGRILYGCVD